MEGAFGAIMPFLRQRLNLNFTEGGFHVTLFAVGSLVCGLVFNWVAKRLHRSILFWGGGSLAMISLAALSMAPSKVISLPAAFTMGFSGAILMILSQTILSTHQPHHRGAAMGESSAIGSAGAMVSPLLIGGFEQIGIGWQAAIFSFVGLWTLLLVLNIRMAIPPAAAVDPMRETSQKLPIGVWIILGIIFLGASTEWSILAWTADFVHTTAGLALPIAASLLTVYFVASVVGRMGVSRLTQRFRLEPLLLVLLLISVGGVVVFWIGQSGWIIGAGLFLMGVGGATFYPICVALAMGFVPAWQADVVSSRISIIASVAILMMPQVLGIVADSYGIGAAFGIIPGFMVGMCVLVWIVWKLPTSRTANPLPEFGEGE